MAYIVQNSVTTYTGNGNSVDVEIPDIANVQVGDYIVFFGTIANSITWSASGYTNVGASNGGNVGVSWLYKKVTTLPETNPTITMSGSQVYEVVGFVVRDADPDDFIDNNQTNHYSSNTTSLEIPSISASNDQSLLVAGVSCRNATGRQFSEEWRTVAYPGADDLIVVSTFQENSGMTPLVDVTHTTNDRGSASLIAIKNKTGGARAVNISGGPEWFMRGLDGLSDPVSLDTRRSTINGKTVGATINLSVSNPLTSGEDGADFYTPSGIDLGVSAGGSGVVGEQNGVVFNISGGHDFSGDNLTFTYYLAQLPINFQDDVGLYLEDGSGNWAVRKLFDQDDADMAASKQIYTHYGSFDTNTDVYPVLDNSGVPDYSNITWWGFTWENRITNTSLRTHVLKNFGHADNPLIFTGGGEGTGGASINPRILTSGVASGAKRRAVAYQGLRQDVLSESVQIGDGVNPTYYYAPFTSLEFQQVGGFVGFGFRRVDRTMEFRIKTSPSDTIDFSSSAISTPSPHDFIIDPSSSISATYNFNGFTISGFYITWLSGVTCNSASFIGCYDIDGKGGTFNRSVFSGSKSTTSALTVNSGAETTNCVFTKNDETYAIEIQDAGTYVLNGNTYSGYTTDLNVTETTGTVTITLGSGDSTPTFTTSGATVEFDLPSGEIAFTGLVSGSQVVVFETGTTTEAFRENASGETESTGSIDGGTYDYTIMKVGYFPIRVSGTEVGENITTIQTTQDIDRAYEPSSGLTFGSTATVDISGKEFDVTTDTTVQNFYSAWKEFWIAESSLVNKTFPIVPFGPDSFSFNDDYEFTSSSIQYLSQDGFRYVNISGGTTAQYCAVLTQGVVAGSQVEYQQDEVASIIDATNTGNMDQVVQFVGDATHGNFDYSNILDLKVQTNGYREAEFDIVSNFGSLEERLYIANLAEIDIAGLTLGDPVISGVTLTDDSASPITWDTGNAISGSFSITITDTNNNTGENILRYLNYNLSLDATFQGKDPFRWPEMVLDTGSTYETIRGTLHTTTGDVEAGVRVIDISGNPHPEFTRFQTDDGTYRVSPVRARVFFENLTTSNVRIYDNSPDNGATEVEQYINTSSDHTYLTPIGATGTYGYVVNRAGYEPIIGTFDPAGNDVTVDGILSQKTLTNGTPSYTGSVSSFLSVTPLADGSRLYLDIGNGAVSVIEAFDEVEDALQTSDGMRYLYNGGGQIAYSIRSAGSFLDMGTGVRLINNAGEVNATLNGFAESVDGTVIEGSNGILYNTVSSADRIATHQGAVWIDATSPNAGTNYPIGTPLLPVNNLLDAVTIANTLGLTQMRPSSTLTLDEDVSGFIFEPAGGSTTLILGISGNHDKCVFDRFFITGTQVGTSLIKNSSMNNIHNLSGTVRGTAFGETFSVSTSAVRFNLFDCYSSVAGDTKPQLDLTGTNGVECNIRNWSGGLQIDNCTGVNNQLSIDVVSGSIKLSSTVTEGDIVVRGIGLLSDEHTGNAIVNTTGFRHVPDASNVTQLDIVNQGVKKASKLIPHNTDI